MKFLKSLFWKLFTAIDSHLKFPCLKEGDICIQCGFDMDAPVTSDLFLMRKRVKEKGVVYGIDPDPANIEIANRLAAQNDWKNIITIHTALSDRSGQDELLIGEKRGWSQITNIPLDSTVSFSGKKVDVSVNTLSGLISEYKIDLNRIRHINLTINGNEYFALKGMTDLLKKAEDISITAIAGRHDETGTINGKPDHKLIIALLKNCGFTVVFRRMDQLFWWSFVVKLLMQQRFVYNKKNYGIIFASKGESKIRWYQSFS